MNEPPALFQDPRAGVYLAAAETLKVMSVQVEALGAELCTDPVIVQRHLTSLQTIDRLSQHLEQIAAVISADDPVAAIDGVKLSELKEHLRRAA